MISAPWRQNLTSPLGKGTYFVDLASAFFMFRCPRDTGEASKKPFSNGFNRIDRGFRRDPAVARSDVKAKKKNLTIARSGASTSSLRQWYLAQASSGVGRSAGARLFAFLRGSIWNRACQHRSSHRLGDTDPLQHIAV
jgi:hypothetical protein